MPNAKSFFRHSLRAFMEKVRPADRKIVDWLAK